MAVGVLALALAGCGGHTTRTDVISAGQVDIQLPPGWTVTRHGVEAPADTAPLAAAAGSASSATTTAAPGQTIPLAKQDPTTEFFQATGAFSACLRTDGVKFIGAPDPKNPSAPSNDPNYIKNLTTCAAQSHIVQALKDFQASQSNLTPAQIKTQNEGYLRWRQCMIGLGWQIPEPKPDAQGRLFSFSTSGGGPQMTPPPGEDILNSPDIQNCAAKTQQPTGGGSGG